MKHQIIRNQYFIDNKGILRDIYWHYKNGVDGINSIVVRSLQVGYKLNKSQVELIKTFKS